MSAREKGGSDSRRSKKNPAPAAASRSGYNSQKLLQHLANSHAYATAASLGGADALDVFATRNGVSLRAAGSTRAAAKELASEGLAEWSRGGASGRERLTITSAGRAHLARLGANEGADPFFAQHGAPEEAAIDGHRVILDRAESPLAWLASRSKRGSPLFDPACFEAGERLRRDLTFAQMLPRVTANWDPSLAGGERNAAPLTYSDHVIDARQRANAALAAVGPEFSGLLMDVCGFLKGLEQVEGERRWPRRSAKLVLGLALAALARHYGLASEAQGPMRAKGIRHWGSEDFRPLIGA